MDLRAALTTISLCAGGGGLDIGLELAVPGARPVALVEREAFACARLVEAMREGLMAPAPVWLDVSTFRGRAWRGLVDGLIGGIPCQPYSTAGRRQGADDERDLWPDARRIIAAARPWFVWIENVAGMLVGADGQIAGAARVRRDLAAMSYRSEIVVCRASEVGASHERARVFILGLADSVDIGCGDDTGLRAREPEFGRGGASGGVGQADTGGPRQQRRPHADLRGPGRGHEGGGSAGVRDAAVVDALGGGRDRRAHEQERGPERRGDAERAGEGIELFPPGPGERALWASIAADRPDLLPATTQSRICGVVDGLAPRVDQLRMLGNGVVPLQAAHAFRLLVALHQRSAPHLAARLVRLMEAA